MSERPLLTKLKENAAKRIDTIKLARQLPDQSGFGLPGLILLGMGTTNYEMPPEENNSDLPPSNQPQTTE